MSTRVPGGADLEVVPAWPADGVGARGDALGPVGDNLVVRALAATGRSARVRLVKRIPPGPGWAAGRPTPPPYCGGRDARDPTGGRRPGGRRALLSWPGGRARVTGIGERLTPLAFEARVASCSCCRRSGWTRPPSTGPGTAWVPDGAGPPEPARSTELEAAALAVEPRLAGWRRALEDATGRPARLAGSGSTWFVDVGSDDLGLEERAWLEQDGERAPLVVARTVPAPT